MLNKKNLKISRVRIVEIDLKNNETANDDGNENEHDVGILGDDGEGATAMAVHPSISH